MFLPIPVLFDTARAIWFRAASTLSMSGGAGAINLSVRPVAQPSRRPVPAPSRCEDDAGGETPPALAVGDACATTDTFNRTQCAPVNPSRVQTNRHRPSTGWATNIKIAQSRNPVPGQAAASN